MAFAARPLVRRDGVPDRRLGRRRAPEIGEHVLQTSATTGAYKKVLMARSFEARFLEVRRGYDGLTEDLRHALFNFGGWTGAGYKGAGSAWLAGGAVILSRECGHRPLHARARSDPRRPCAIPAGATDGPAARIYALPQGNRISMWGGATPSQMQVDLARERITADVFNSIGMTEAHAYAQTRLETPEDRRWHQVRPEAQLELVDEEDLACPGARSGVSVSPSATGPRNTSTILWPRPNSSGAGASTPATSD